MVVEPDLRLHSFRIPCVQAPGNEPCCQPMVADVTTPGDGAEVRDGAVQLACLVWAPYQVPPADLQISQHVPSVDRSASVMAPPSPDPA